MQLIYTLGIHVYVFIIRLASIGNQKANLWIAGRKNLLKNLKNSIPAGTPIVWFHVSSLGEFEQGRPVMEAFREAHPEYKLLLTFFSPSGYEIRKNYSGADYIFYLPADTPRNARQFIQTVNPKVAFFVKYDFWFHYLNRLQKKEIPTYLFSAIFRRNQLFFRWYGSWYRKMLQFFTLIYVQNQESAELLKNIGITKIIVAGDTRFDRVFALAQTSKELPLIEKFTANNPVIVAGSTWEKDEELIALYSKENPTIKWIIAPHEIHQAHLDKINNLFQGQLMFYSKSTIQNINQFNILVIDSIGILSSLYKYGKIAYIGGGFGKGIHNTLEAATYGLPIVFGPNYLRFQEACDLIDQKAGFSIKTYSSFKQKMDELIQSEDIQISAGKAALKYVHSMKGGTQTILQNTLFASI
ncbi:MAG: glycosyltransferase N-terminal domain-containing protein [Salinivirgaceae bacterium]